MSTSGLSAALETVCVRALGQVGVTGAAVQLSSQEGAGTVVASSGEPGGWVAELEFELGEGPATDAFAEVRPVLVSDLAADGFERWPAFTAAATAHRVCAVFAFPLNVGAARFGTLTLWRAEPGGLAEAPLRAALSLCERAVEILLASQVAHPTGDAVPRSLSQEVGPSMDLRSEVYQAQGMVMVDLGITLVEALARLRAYGFVQGLHLGEVAQAVVDGQLRLADDRPAPRDEESGS